ncbi:hypothetical protein COCON_G00195410 [Conger conger]|uniref:Thioredoxin domain-containing protein n=1 Tax=Conger conger TaxID=82655 RepID=A0A9Q1HR38_CONCO|nr:hypothetical protein COCON_G00195410 [Conger conger]
MKATLHALSFVLVCLVAYYIAMVSQMKEELLVEKHRWDQDGTNVPDQDGTNALGAAPAEVPEAQEEETQQPHPLARGWGEDIDWVETYEEALRTSKTSKKPLMVIHHRESCPICKDLKAAFSGHEEIQRMAKEEFVMFNLMHETKDSNLAPDGYYVPRIIFVDPAMVVRSDITRPGKKYMYSYTDNDMQQLLDNMKKVKIPLNLPEL